MPGRTVVDTHARSAGTFLGALVRSVTHSTCAPAFVPGHHTPDTHVTPAGYFLGATPMPTPIEGSPLLLTRPCEVRHPSPTRRVLSQGAIPDSTPVVSHASLFLTRPQFLRRPKAARRVLSCQPWLIRHPSVER